MLNGKSTNIILGFGEIYDTYISLACSTVTRVLFVSDLSECADFMFLPIDFNIGERLTKWLVRVK